MMETRSKSSESQLSCRKTASIFRLEKELAKTRNELNAAMKQLEDTENELIHIASNADFATGLLKALVEMVFADENSPLTLSNEVAAAVYYLDKQQLELEA